MKFYCDSCNTKYSISDEKVRGKVLKVRCKSCGHIITVREAKMPQASSPRQAPPQAVPQTNWHYSINGNSSGPFDLAALKARYVSGELGDETYVWHETLVAWKPVGEVSEFAECLAQGQAIKPRPKTLGFTGKLEAIQAPAIERDPDTAKPTPESKARSVTPMPVARQDRLNNLRQKLKAEPKAPELQTEPFEEAPTSMLTFAPGVDAAAPVGRADVPRVGVELPTFDLPPASGSIPTEPDLHPSFEPETSSRSNILQTPANESPDDSGVIPFFPDVPKLESPAAPHVSQATTGSLLIEMKSMQKEGRGKALWKLVGISVIMGGLVATAIVLYVQRPKKAPVVVAQKEKPREIKERTYSKGTLAKFGQIELGEEVLDPNVDVAALELEFTDDEVETYHRDDPKPKKPSIKSSKPIEKTGSGVVAAKAAPKMSKTKKTGEPLTGRAALLAYKGGGGTVVNIDRPEDKLAMAAAMPTELSKEAAKRGFRKVTKSVAICRERHSRRAKFEASKVFLTVVVEPTGKVSTIRLKPSSVQNTEFHKCMNSHRGRWRFAAWKGASVEINRSFVMQ